MASRMDKYEHTETVPTRSNKNQELYKQVYNAYDEFENLVVPSNSREINISDLEKEISTRKDYRELRDYEGLVTVKPKETEVIDEPLKKMERSDSKAQVYDINELLNKAVSSTDEPKLVEPKLSNEEYLKKLKLDNYKMKAEKMIIPSDDIELPQEEEDALLQTANLSLDILSDLKSDNEETKTTAPIKEDVDNLEDTDENTFYSDNYKFSKKDFEDKAFEPAEDDEEDDEKEPTEKSGNGKFFLKVFLLVFGIALVVGGLIYFINYFNKV